MSRFRNISVALKIHLFKNFCYSFYGCQLWDLQHKCLSQFDVIWRKSIRRLWHLPYTTHCNLLSMFAFGNNFCSILCNRFVNFFHDCLSSRNVLIRFISNLAAASQMHVCGKNLFYVSNIMLPTVSPVAVLSCELLQSMVILMLKVFHLMNCVLC